jgi:broad specificity phosphatase PhoE
MTGAPDAVVYLCRHGRTALNAAGVLRGRLDPPLDEAGEAEATGLADTFRGVTIAAVVSSPLSRARQTATAVANAFGIAPAVDDRLADRDYGPWVGTSRETVVARFGSLDSAPGVEARDVVTARAKAAMLDAARRGAPVLLVAHDAINRAVLSCLAGTGTNGVDLPQPTGCWNRLERRGGSWTAPIIGAVPGDDRRP